MWRPGRRGKSPPAMRGNAIHKVREPVMRAEENSKAIWSNSRRIALFGHCVNQILVLNYLNLNLLEELNDSLSFCNFRKVLQSRYFRAGTFLQRVDVPPRKPTWLLGYITYQPQGGGI